MAAPSTTSGSAWRSNRPPRGRTPWLPARAIRSLRRKRETRTDRRRCRAAAGRHRRRIPRMLDAVGDARFARRVAGRGRRTRWASRPAPGRGLKLRDRRAPSSANARIRPIWFLRGCRSPTERMNGAAIAKSARAPPPRRPRATPGGIPGRRRWAPPPLCLRPGRRRPCRMDAPREFAAGQNLRRAVHRAPHGPAAIAGPGRG